jgi:hypothetical protein
MARILIPLVIIASFIVGCSDDRPTQPERRTFDLSEYYESLDSLYYKVWSDGSSRQWHGRQTIGTTPYVIIRNNSGDMYYYSAGGYAGFQTAGYSLILFDKPIPSLPSDVEFGKHIANTTTFSYGGYLFTMKITYALLDTASVAVTFGVFNPCPHFSEEIVLSASGESETTTSQFWIASGPGSIRLRNQDQTVIDMVRGFVNGQSWGVSRAVRDCSDCNLSKHLVSEVSWMAAGTSALSYLPASLATNPIHRVPNPTHGAD